MNEIRKMGSRFWELYSSDTIVVVGMILTIVAMVISLVAGAIVGYIWTIVVVLLIWEKDLQPFNWLGSDATKLTLVVLAPLTIIGIAIGMVVWILGAPFFFWHSIQKDQARRRKQIEEGDEYIELNEPRLRNWLIGVPIYYLCLAGFLFGMWALAKSS